MIVLTLFAVVIGGTIAAVYASPIFGLTTVAMVAVLIRASQRAKVEVEASNELMEFPPAVRDAIAAAMSKLESSPARRLLMGVVVQARPIFGARSSLLDEAAERVTRENAGALVQACCDSARELAALDSVATSPSATKARTQLTERLSRAAAALGSLYVAGLEHGSAASNRVSELVDEIVADASARRAAAAEMSSF